MQRKYITYRWLVAMWLLLWGYMLSSATEFKSTSSYVVGAAYGVSTANGVSYNRAYAPGFSRDICPAFQFRSTSSIVAPVDNTADCYTMKKKMRRDPWDDPDGDPTGVVPDVPIGEPLILLVLAFLYVLYKRRSRRQA